jgi:hypothetical protein
MDIRKQKYLQGQKYGVKITTKPSDQEKKLFEKYYEPSINAGGEFTDGTTSFMITDIQKKIYTDTPINHFFDTVLLGIDYIQAGTRANIYINEIVNRITEVIIELRTLDQETNTETDVTIVI